MLEIFWGETTQVDDHQETVRSRGTSVTAAIPNHNWFVVCRRSIVIVAALLHRCYTGHHQVIKMTFLRSVSRYAHTFSYKGITCKKPSNQDHCTQWYACALANPWMPEFCESQSTFPPTLDGLESVYIVQAKSTCSEPLTGSWVMKGWEGRAPVMYLWLC